MIKVLLAIHLMIALAMVGGVLLQRSEGGALGIGGGSFMTGRQAGNLLTRITAFLAVAFMTTSMALAILGGGGAPRRLILEQATPLNGTEAPGDAVQIPAPPLLQEALPAMPAPPTATGE